MKNSVISLGYTLFEILIALFIIGTITLFSIPSLQGIIERYHYRNIVTEFINDLHFAKHYANRYNTRISICNLNIHGSCTQKKSNNWSYGWRLYNDPNGSFNFSDLIIIKEKINTYQKITIQSNINILNSININKFRQYGKTQGTGLPNGHFLICAPNQPTYKIYINVFGNARYEKFDEQFCTI